MTQHTYIAYSGFMLADGAHDWQEEVTATSPAAALQEAIISIFVHTGRVRYPNEFGVNLASVAVPTHVIASAELSGLPVTYKETTENSMVSLSDWQVIVAYLKTAHGKAQRVLYEEGEEAK